MNSDSGRKQPWRRRRREARSWAALAAAKARGTKLGSPRDAEAASIARAGKTLQPLPPEVLKLITDWRGQGRGLRNITRELNRLNIRTPQGKQWYASTVRSAYLTSEGH